VSTQVRRFGAFRHPNYRQYFVGQVVSQVGTWMQSTAQAILVLQLTNFSKAASAADLGIVVALQGLPILFIGPWAGALADRWSKRWMLTATQVAEMLLAFLLGTLVLTHVVQIWHVYVLALALGVATGTEAPVRQAFVKEMVGRDDLMNAVSLNSVTLNGARVIGPSVAGFLIYLVGVTSSFFINGLSFAFVIGALVFMHNDQFFALESPPPMSILRSLAQGFSYVRHAASARTIIGFVAVLSFFASTTTVLVPLFAYRVLNVGSIGLGVMFSAMGAGSLTASTIASFAQKATWRRVLLGAFGIPLAEIAYAFSRNYVLSIVLMYLTGLALHTFFTAALTGVQQRVPDQLRGRVVGIHMTLTQGLVPGASILAGTIASLSSAPVGMLACAVIALSGVAGITAWMYMHRATADLSLDPDTAAGVTSPATMPALFVQSEPPVAARPQSG
jgi:MFS family permease